MASAQVRRPALHGATSRGRAMTMVVAPASSERHIVSPRASSETHLMKRPPLLQSTAAPSTARRPCRRSGSVAKAARGSRRREAATGGEYRDERREARDERRDERRETGDERRETGDERREPGDGTVSAKWRHANHWSVQYNPGLVNKMGDSPGPLAGIS